MSNKVEGKKNGKGWADSTIWQEKILAWEIQGGIQRDNATKKMT
jgi:hypothetical protein